jgi:hypothetical protein
MNRFVRSGFAVGVVVALLPTALTLLPEGKSYRGGPYWQINLLVFDTGPSENARLRLVKELKPER